MDLIQLLIKQYGLSESEAQSYAKLMGEVNNNPIQKAMQDKLEAEARYKFLTQQQEIVARRDTIMNQSAKARNADLVKQRDAMMNKPKGEIQMPEDNSPRDRRLELRALADYKMQGFFPGEIQMAPDNSPRDARMKNIDNFYNPGGEIQMFEDNSPRNANIEKFYGQYYKDQFKGK